MEEVSIFIYQRPALQAPRHSRWFVCDLFFHDVLENPQCSGWHCSISDSPVIHAKITPR